jgi:hypothetical protein
MNKVTNEAFDWSHETVWATQKQIADLFGVERSVVTKHVAKIGNYIRN